MILAAHIRYCEVHAWDISEEVIKVAAENAENNNVPVNFERHDILQAVEPDKKFDIVVSNPPYVTRKESEMMGKNVLDHEPLQALFVKNEPLEFYKAIIEKKEKLLNTGGKFYFEINESYGNEVKKLLIESGLKSVRIIKDIHGKDRFATAFYSVISK